ncbi:MAG: DNA adenine methylase [Candidatus Bathyarchaeia archaeon]
MAKPILKWAGGKRSLLSEITSLFPSDYKERKYHEPFIGGGAVFFEIKPESGSINDINSRLMNFYKVVRDKPKKLVKTAKQYKHDEDEYYKQRDRFNEPNIPDVEEAALLLYLNKIGFNGLYRENSDGEFNVPFGRYKNPTIVPEKRIRKASKILQNVEIFNRDFEYIVDYSEEGDLCYFDPPYLPVSDTADFTSYSKDGFSYQDQLRLRDACIRLDEKGVFFVLSNSYVEPLIEKYEETDSFRILTVQANRSINSDASNRGPINEILVTNIPMEESRSYGSKLTHFNVTKN